MRNNGKGLGFGIFLLTVGLIWLLGIANIVTWSTFSALITLWPLILVAVGVGFIFRNNRLIRTLSWLVLLAIVIGYGYFYPDENAGLKYNLHFGDNKNFSSAKTTVELDKKPQNEKAELILDYGAMQVNIGSDTSKLINASINGAIVEHSEDLDGRTAVLKFKMKNKDIINLGALDKLRSDFHLGRDVIWDLKFDTGAIDGNLDLSGLKVEKIDIKTSASTLKLDMGSYNTEMKINSGASTINVTLPSDTGMNVKIGGGLNNTNLAEKGWTEKDGRYYSPDFDAKAFKIETEISNGFGNLTVENR